MSDSSVIILVILAIYMLLNIIIGILYSKIEARTLERKGFISNYFIGGRSMGGLVLAMTFAATFASASSFIGGPGIAYSRGLVWVFISVIQIPASFIVLGILGKKFAIVSRRIHAVTVTDYLRSRYESSTVVISSSIALVLFFIAQMIAQFIGGAVFLESITGLPYKAGLIIFALVVIVYTSFGGFKAVAINDTIQGFIMVLGCFLVLVAVINAAGGWDIMLDKVDAANPAWDSITTDGTTPMAFVLSFWVLVGFGILGLPQTAVRGMAFKDTKAMHNAIIYGTIVVGIMMILMTMVGVFAPSVISESEVVNTDYIVPAIVLKYMNPVVAGLFIAAPLSAIMSTVAALLLLASALDPPDLIVWVNLFAMGGLECAFLCPIVFGLYWKKANATDAIASTIVSVLSYVIMKGLGVSVLGTDAIVPAIVLSFIAFVIGSLVGKKTRKEILDIYF